MFIHYSFIYFVYAITVYCWQVLYYIILIYSCTLSRSNASRRPSLFRNNPDLVFQGPKPNRHSPVTTRKIGDFSAVNHRVLYTIGTRIMKCFWKIESFPVSSLSPAFSLRTRQTLGGEDATWPSPLKRPRTHAQSRPYYERDGSKIARDTRGTT